MKRVYQNNKITVYWDAGKCTHSTRCFAQLPAVFNLRKRPWIDLEAADAGKIKRAIESCPSGALTCKMNE